MELDRPPGNPPQRTRFIPLYGCGDGVVCPPPPSPGIAAGHHPPLCDTGDGPDCGVASVAQPAVAVFTRWLGDRLVFRHLEALGGGRIRKSSWDWLQLFFSLLRLLRRIRVHGQRVSFLMNVLLVPGGQPGYWVNYPVPQWIELVIFGLVVV